MLVVGKCSSEIIVLLHDGVRDEGNGNMHVFIFIHEFIEVKVFDATSHEFGIGHGDHAVEQNFDGGEVHHFGAHITIMCDAVAANGEADALQFVCDRQLQCIGKWPFCFRALQPLG